jgi:hypothetical protein
MGGPGRAKLATELSFTAVIATDILLTITVVRVRGDLVRGYVNGFSGL